ncbi:MAG: polysaccharide deacetylase family protein [Planctomycetes bacterium]|nr:polysaccharide deacetylase family protein [Planctomycetota bacterium]
MSADRAILTYHSLDDRGSPISLAPTAFERHLDWIVAAGIATATVADFPLAGERPGLAISFDDGFENFATEAWPRLRARGLPATLYVVAGLVGGDNRWGGRDHPGIPRLGLLDWETLGRLAEEGLEIGCHSMSHPDLRGLEAGRLVEETVAAADRIEQMTGRRPRTYCYPFGHVDAAARAAVGARFERAVTTEFRLVGAAEDVLLLPRIDAFYFARAGRLEGFGGAGFRGFVRRRRLLRRIRGLLPGR